MVHNALPAASAFSAPPTFPRFEIHADDAPQTLARIIGRFAAQNLAPSDLHARTSRRGLWIGLHIDMEAAAAERMAEALRALVCVEAVVLIPAPSPTDRQAPGGRDHTVKARKTAAFGSRRQPAHREGAVANVL